MLFKTLDEIRTYTTAPNKGMSFSTWIPLISQCEEDYIIPIISQDQYDELDTQYQGDVQTAQNTTLLAKVQRALAYYSLYEVQKTILASISDMGITEQQSKEGTASPARQWVNDRIEANVLQKADRFADRILDFLEANEADYPLWVASDEYSISKELFINKTAELNRYLNIQNSKRTFIALRAYIEQSELRYIKPAIGKQYFVDLKSKLIAGTMDANDEVILPMLRRSLANFALYEGLPFLAINVQGNGVTVSSSNDGTKMSTSALSSTRDGLDGYRKSIHETAIAFLQNMKDFMNDPDNIDNYPLYRDSDAYNMQQPDSDIPDNANSNSFFV